MPKKGTDARRQQLLNARQQKGRKQLDQTPAQQHAGGDGWHTVSRDLVESSRPAIGQGAGLDQPYAVQEQQEQQQQQQQQKLTLQHLQMGALLAPAALCYQLSSTPASAGALMPSQQLGNCSWPLT